MRSKVKSRFGNGKWSGFTLIELLVVIAILGALAAITLVTIDPLEQIKRASDSGRKEVISQLGRAFQSYNSIKQDYPTVGAANPGTFLTQLQTNGEMKNLPTNKLPPNVTDATHCNNVAAATNYQNGFCYTYDATNKAAVLYVELESSGERSKCNVGLGGPRAFYIWTSATGQSGIVCKAASNEWPAISDTIDAQ